ncbi:transporter [Allostreptomyces psammosilenae]|uniref:ABC-2 type transport system permease protein n=1 Tax=Allostreptomyces psammosilenae TaxID=1892865 RepID=A0A853A2P4_9ACTN|nr:transporter [Allostreptomyces psammosilenae]NYI07740.1 ABC-2 type transport system permease protein [Allostreptomyces psammosilenae]
MSAPAAGGQPSAPAAPAPFPAAPSPAAPPTASPGLGATARLLAAMKARMVVNGLRQSRARTVVYVIGSLVALVYAAGALLLMAVARGQDFAFSAPTLLFSVFALGWAVLPLFVSGGGDETLDPSRLVLLPLRPAQLLAGMVAASAVGLGPAFTLLFLLTAPVALVESAAGLVAAVPAVLLALLLCLTLSRAVAAANTRMLNSRRGRDLALLSGILVALGGNLVGAGVRQLGSGSLEVVDALGEVLRWLPPGMAVDAIRAAEEGRAAASAGRLLVVAATVAALMWWWQRSLHRLMVTADSSTLLGGAQEPGPRRRRAADRAGADAMAGPVVLRRLRLVPGGRAGTAMARQARYGWRDPRGRVAWVAVLGMGAIMPLVFAAQGTASVYQSLWAAAFLGNQIGNVFGMDGSAFWTVAATITDRRDARAELLGRLLAVAVVAVPYVVVVTGLLALLTGSGEFWPALGLALGVVGVQFAVGLHTSVRLPYAVPERDGTGGAAAGQAGLAWGSMTLGAVASLLVCLPLLAVLLPLREAGGAAALLMVPIGVGWGLAAVLVALRTASAALPGRLPEILWAVAKG